jgi:hypothetical protein
VKRLFTLVALLPALAAAESATGARRFALIIGVNDGGPSRLRLRYADSDAQAVAEVFRQLGGVAEADMMLLLEPDHAQIAARVDELGRRLDAARATSKRLELIVYYSGHSDEEGLLVRGERIPYTELRQRLDAVPADLRVAILDSCASGALTRVKGGSSRPPFLLDESSSLKGHAFLTSSAADEVAQESDRVGGSFFTHYLLSAMRGAADLSRSGRVTLTDAYAFAFQETLARTQRTQGGAQHPSYDIALQGSGDLVLTDLRSTSAGLVLGKEIAGRVYVRDGDDRLLVELRKTAGREIELGLAKGPYRVTVDDKETRLLLEDGSRARLDPSALKTVSTEYAMARGSVPVFEPMPVVFSAVPGAALGVGPGGGGVSGDTSNKFAMNLTIGRGGDLSGVELSLIGAWRRGDVSGAQLAFGGNYTEGNQSGAALSDIFNLTGGDFTGVQFTGAANWAGNGIHGWQAAGGFNYAGGQSKGLQLATGANVITGSMIGTQLAVGFNSASQITGVQTSVGANHAGSVTGVQASVAANVADDVSGLQLGLVNIGKRVSGVQLGLVNIADSSSASIGLVNFITDGIHDLGGEVSELGEGLVGRIGGRRVYTLFFLGGTDERGGPDLHLGVGGTPIFGLGVGFHFKFGDWSVDPEFLGRHMLATMAENGNPRIAIWENHILATARVAFGVPLFGRLQFVFGPTFNTLFDYDKAFSQYAYGWTIVHPGYQMKLWPGAFAGIRF